jgi:hypothetical protein
MKGFDGTHSCVSLINVVDIGQMLNLGELMDFQ